MNLPDDGVRSMARVDDPRPPVHPRVARIAAYAWRLIAIAIVVVAGLWLLRQARAVVFPVLVAVFIARVMSPLNHWLVRHRFRRGLAAALSLLLFLVVLVGVVGVTAAAFADEADTIGPTITQALDDVERWLVEVSPVTVPQDVIDRLRERAGDRFDDLTRSSDGELGSRATVAAEAIAGCVLAVILTFFMLRDGALFVDWILRRTSEDRRGRVRDSLDAAWKTLGGYLRGASLLGVFEAIAIGLTLFLTGGRLVAPVMVLTFLGAFLPLVGAVGAGLVAMLVALVTAGTTAAIIVGVVALVVQQLDNDVLAPVIYGRMLQLHPAVILLSLAVGGALFGLVGAALAVPLVAIGANALAAYDNSVEA
jgi:putative heme transporter